MKDWKASAGTFHAEKHILLESHLIKDIIAQSTPTIKVDICIYITDS